MNKPTNYEEYLNAHGTLTYTNVGTSMLPLLRQGRDLFTIRRKDDVRCRVGDVVLYRRPPNHYVLHRVVKVRTDDYVILGDNCVVKEYGICDGDIIGVMTGYVRDGKEHSTREVGYRLYTFFILHSIGLRRLVKQYVTRLRKGRN